ncbi:Clp protease ClpP [Hymenobacter lapidiphilus]|uniref:Clp protease ClpP n=1 Tax=Hymenobacter lapidiphilus TaxID=2608003 RepID=A0A7Y7PSM3_9BACT|nr:Clp protease ClpP [Hymenobacter lapidiphilus]NVO33276.1 Clp protease ClpP [Hymenobacter lapidiphilus]
MRVAKVNFLDSIGCADFFYGTTLQDVRYAVEGYSAFEGGEAAKYPESVELYFWKCYGGDVYEGYAIYNYLRELSKQGVTVKCYIHGLCASIAVLVALAADEIYMADAALLMTHAPMVDTGVFANAADHREAAAFLDKITAQITSRYLARTGGKLTPEMAAELLTRETYLSADEALALGFVTAKLTDDLLPAPVGEGKVLNYFKPQTPQNMAITAADETRLVDKFINAAKNYFAPKNEEAAPTNLTVALEGEAGNIYVDTTADDLAQGDMVYTDEALTLAAADGNYTLADARSITVAAGAIESITSASNSAAPGADELAAANSRNAELEAQVAALTAERDGATNSVRNLQNRLKAVPGSTGNPTPAGTQTPANKAAAGAAAATTPRLNVVRR